MINSYQELSNAEQEAVGKWQEGSSWFMFDFLVKFQLIKKFVGDREEMEKLGMEQENENEVMDYNEVTHKQRA